MSTRPTDPSDDSLTGASLAPIGAGIELPTGIELPVLPPDAPAPEPAAEPDEAPDEDLAPVNAAARPSMTIRLAAPDAPPAAESASPEADAGPLLGVGSVFAGRYRVEESLPADGRIARAAGIQEPMVRRVTLSALDAANLDEEARTEREERFLYDAGVLAALRHPNVAATYDYGRSKAGACYAAHELLYGFGLDESLARGPLSSTRFPRIARQLVRGLAAMHDAGVVHRNVGPHAVIMEPGGGHGVPRWTRFGLGQPLGAPGEPRSGAWPELIAPEVADGEGFTPASDVYALGVTLHIAAVGTPPKKGRLHADVPATWKPLIRRCLEDDADLRYPSASDMLKELPPQPGDSKPLAPVRRVAPSAPAVAAPAVVVAAPPPAPAATSPVHLMMAGAIGAAVALGVALGLGLKASMRESQAPPAPTAPVVAEAVTPEPAPAVLPEEGSIGAAGSLPEHRPGVPVGARPVIPPVEERAQSASADPAVPRTVVGAATRDMQVAGTWKAVDPSGDFTLELTVDAEGNVSGKVVRGGAADASVAGTAAASAEGWTLALTITGTDGPLTYAGVVDGTGAHGQVMRGSTFVGPWSARR